MSGHGSGVRAVLCEFDVTIRSHGNIHIEDPAPVGTKDHWDGRALMMAT